MREFVQRQRQVLNYEEFLRDKVASAREQIGAGDYASANDVEAQFAARRAQFLAKVGDQGGVKVFWAYAAEQDRTDIIEYISQDSSLVVIRMDELFAEAVGRLAKQPNLGKIG